VSYCQTGMAAKVSKVSYTEWMNEWMNNSICTFGSLNN
jgi:hypothetical protein